MLYDTIALYNNYLKQNFTAETARTYTAHIKPLLKNQSVNFTADKLDVEKVLDILSGIKYKNNFSKCKNAFLHFCDFLGVDLGDKYIARIEDLHHGTTRRYRKLKHIDIEAIEKKIKGLRNPKLKLSYQTMLATGLRVGELAQITKDDCLITADEIHFSFVGKGGISCSVVISRHENPRFYDDLILLIENAKHKIFYSTIYLQIDAKKLGFTCHDLRRIYSRAEYKKTKSKEAVRRKLRHTNIKTTNIYLKSKFKK